MCSRDVACAAFSHVLCAGSMAKHTAWVQGGPGLCALVFDVFEDGAAACVQWQLGHRCRAAGCQQRAPHVTRRFASVIGDFLVHGSHQSKQKSIAYPHKARCQEEAKSGPVHRAPRCERDERCGHRSRLTVDSQRIDGMRTGMGTHAWAQAGTSTGTGMSTCISMGMGIANT